MSSQPGRNDLENELAALRKSLAHDASAAGSDARTLTDWRYHFRAHPWLLCGGALCLGWLLVPRRVRGNATELGNQAAAQPVDASAMVTQPLVRTLVKLGA